MAANLTFPEELTYLLTTDRPAHVSFIAPDGTLRLAIMWLDYDGEHVLTSSPLGSFKGRVWRKNPQVALSVADKENMWRFLAISGRVTEIRPDTGLAFIDKLSQRYTGQEYRRRNFEREIFVITPDRIRASTGRG